MTTTGKRREGGRSGGGRCGAGRAAITVWRWAAAWVTVSGLGAAVPTGAPIAELQRRMAAGELTAVALTEAYLARIEAVDRAGPRLRAVIETNPAARAIAAELDAERRAGRVRGPLHGIPVLVKDNIATADEMETTAGSLALVGARPPRDAFVVTRLREAGAVLLGKTNLSEWANFRGERSVSGWSARGGQTLNPHVLDRSPSGSSSGSAAAVAAELCAAAVGTETNGSIVSPASACGIVGFKPTVGGVSRSGIIPIAASFDTAGPMTRTVADAALMLAAMAGADPDDAATAEAAGRAREWAAAALRPGALRGARIGVLRPEGYWPAVDGVFAAALTALRAGGAEIVEVPALPRLATGAMLEVFRYELKAGVNAYLATLGGRAPVKSLADVIAFNERNWAREMPLFGQQHFVAAQARGGLTEPAYLAALAECRRVTREGIDTALTTHRLDALMAVTRSVAELIAANEGPDPAFDGRRPTGGISTPAAIAGYPHVTVPGGTVAGLPVGISFFGGAWSDAALLALAADFEARTPARVGPAYRATLGVGSR